MYSLNGKTALITGGSRGIGRAFAIELAKCGANIVLNYAGNDAKAAQVKAEIEAMDRQCTLAKADLTQEDCAEKIAQIAGSVDILILNASVQHRENWLHITPRQFNEQINCNLRSALLLMQKFIPSMKENRWGRVITIGSVQERKPHPDMLVYSASKSALTLMAKSLALQLAPYGITVNSIAPGVILTDRNTEALSDTQYFSKVVDKIPMGYCGKANECVGVLKMLCSDEGRYITAQNIFVDGGMEAY